MIPNATHIIAMEISIPSNRVISPLAGFFRMREFAKHFVLEKKIHGWSKVFLVSNFSVTTLATMN